MAAKVPNRIWPRNDWVDSYLGSAKGSCGVGLTLADRFAVGSELSSLHKFTGFSRPRDGNHGASTRLEKNVPLTIRDGHGRVEGSPRDTIRREEVLVDESRAALTEHPNIHRFAVARIALHRVCSDGQPHIYGAA